MANNVNLVLVLSAIDRATSVIAPVLSKIDNKLQAVHKTAGMVGTKAFAVGREAGAMAATMAAAIAVPTKAAMEFETVMEDISQKTDQAGFNVVDFGRRIRDLAPIVNKTATEVASGVDVLAGFGLDPNSSLAMMRPVGIAATAYRAEVVDLAKTAFATYDNLKVPIDQTGLALAAAARAGKEGAFELKDMARYFPSVTASYQALGQTGVNAVADLAAAFQAVRKGAGDNEEAANNMINVLAKINSPTTRRKFEALGVDLVSAMEEAAKKGQTPIEAIAEITNKALKGNLGNLGDLFEDMQVQKGLRAIIQNMEYYRKVREVAGKATEADTGKDFDTRMKTMAELTKSGMIVALDLAIELGNALAPILKDLAQWITPYVKGMAAWIKAHPTLTGIILKGVVAMAALSTAISALSFIVGGVAKTFGVFSTVVRFVTNPVNGLSHWLFVAHYRFLQVGEFISGRIIPIFLRLSILLRTGMVIAFNAVRTAIIAMGRALLANPILLIVAAIAAAAYLIYDNWEPIKRFFVELWDKVVATFHVVVEKFKQLGPLLMDGLVEGLKAAALGPVNAIAEIGEMIAQKFRSTLKIKSPSRVFVEYGKFVSLGAAVGMQSAMPAVASASQNLTTTVTAPAITRAAGGGGGGVTVHYAPQVTINGGSPAAKDDFTAMLQQHAREISNIVNNQNRLEGRKVF